MWSALSRGLVLGGLLAVGPAANPAATLEVAPVVHELPPGRNALSMSVANRGSAAATVQVRCFVWSQVDGQDRLVPADGVLLSPAVFTIGVGATQTVRALFADDRAPQERTYRLLVDEIPRSDDGERVRFALRLSVPVFMAATGQQAAALNWKVEAGTQTLTAVNQGGARERVREIELRRHGGERLRATNAAGPYLLAGAVRGWSLAGAAATLRPGEPVTLSAQTDAGPVEVSLVVAP